VQISLLNHNFQGNYRCSIAEILPAHGIADFTTTSDGKYLFVACFSALAQFRIDTHELVKTYRFGKDPQTVTTSWDSKYAFVGHVDGSLTQICVESQTVTKDYGKIHSDRILRLAVTRDNNFLVTGNESGEAKIISIESQTIFREFDKIGGQIAGDNLFWNIGATQLARGDQSLFPYDDSCNLKLMDLTDGTTIKDFGQAHDSWVGPGKSKVATGGGEYVFTISKKGDLKQWSVAGVALVGHFGNISDKIYGICDWYGFFLCTDFL
jgi:hypothetical protein